MQSTIIIHYHHDISLSLSLSLYPESNNSTARPCSPGPKRTERNKTKKNSRHTSQPPELDGHSLGPSQSTQLLSIYLSLMREAVNVCIAHFQVLFSLFFFFSFFFFLRKQKRAKRKNKKPGWPWTRQQRPHHHHHHHHHDNHHMPPRGAKDSLTPAARREAQFVGNVDCVTTLYPKYAYDYECRHASFGSGAAGLASTTFTI